LLCRGEFDAFQTQKIDLGFPVGKKQWLGRGNRGDNPNQEIYGPGDLPCDCLRKKLSATHTRSQKQPVVDVSGLPLNKSR
jgi:hypothetical protein